MKATIEVSQTKVSLHLENEKLMLNYANSEMKWTGTSCKITMNPEILLKIEQSEKQSHNSIQV